TRPTAARQTRGVFHRLEPMKNKTFCCTSILNVHPGIPTPSVLPYPACASDGCPGTLPPRLSGLRPPLSVRPAFPPPFPVLSHLFARGNPPGYNY
ncbi:hypothetical protein, partial [Prevotella heparinolytica]|uniref:hypothetical protein n=1 Tax=Prevotella heparinolytica TaxID=28113 RepID=UPI001BE09DCC